MPSTDYIACESVVHTLYSTHHNWLNTWLRSRLGNAADAADLAQDTFLRLLQKTERFELKAPRAFLRTIARGLVIDHWRREEIQRAYLESIAHLPQALAPSAEARALVLELLPWHQPAYREGQPGRCAQRPGPYSVIYPYQRFAGGGLVHWPVD